MPEDIYSKAIQPETCLTDELHVFDCPSVPIPPGTKAPSRLAGQERVASELPVTDQFEIFTEQVTRMPPGTMAPPRPGRRGSRLVRIALPVGEPAAEVVADLLRRVQSLVDGLDADPTKLDALRQAAAALPKAG